MTLRNLKDNKSTGLDKIPAKILKLASDIIAPSLTFIFNLSLATGIYVDDWKRARVTPFYKSEDKKKFENYRPISILPIISKVIGREVFRQLYHYLSENSLLSRYQSRFRLFEIFGNFALLSTYADDTEIYASAKDGDELVTNINSDLENVRKWMLQNKLSNSSNKDKTYLYWIVF
jgi:hypothetical protein